MDAGCTSHRPVPNILDLSGATPKNRVTISLGHIVGSRFLSRPTYAMENSNDNSVTTFPSIDPLAPADTALRDELAGNKEQPPKKRSTAVSLDPKLLLSEKGLPRLRRHGRAIKFYGKGREDEDLKRIMEFYQIWAHSLYPRLNMKDFSERVVKVCSSQKQCKEALNVWREELVQGASVDNMEGELSGITIQDSNETDDLWGDNASTTLPHDDNGDRVSPNPHQTSQLSEEQRRRIEENRLKALSRRNLQSNTPSLSQPEEHWDPLEDLAVGPEPEEPTDPAEEYVDPAEEYI
ncbi:hypothetical protein INT43_008694 [Umbelopsis isabellina]|uniref:Chromosome segregation in meiosis protein n=1 Tax=Mortierella isabellina TaxID=91625 RepID=A0A8H7PVK9_MORIS|nr:hypothetical protein INT43_008694 [Umbelopsis isabellina]